VRPHPWTINAITSWFCRFSKGGQPFPGSCQEVCKRRQPARSFRVGVMARTPSGKATPSDTAVRGVQFAKVMFDDQQCFSDQRRRGLAPGAPRPGGTPAVVARHHLVLVRDVRDGPRQEVQRVHRLGARRRARTSRRGFPPGRRPSPRYSRSSARSSRWSWCRSAPPSP
jgi:hypothetical protein